MCVCVFVGVDKKKFHTNQKAQSFETKHKGECLTSLRGIVQVLILDMWGKWHVLGVYEVVHHKCTQMSGVNTEGTIVYL